MTFVDGDQAGHVAAIRQFKLDIAFVTGNTQWPDRKTKRLTAPLGNLVGMHVNS